MASKSRLPIDRPVIVSEIEGIVFGHLCQAIEIDEICQWCLFRQKVTCVELEGFRQAHRICAIAHLDVACFIEKLASDAIKLLALACYIAEPFPNRLQSFEFTYQY